MIAFRPPRSADLEHVASNMRAIDALECRAIGEHSPLEALQQGVAESDWSFVAEIDEVPMCIFGVAGEGMLSNVAAPWLLGVDGIERHARTLLAYTPYFLGRMRAEYDELTNMVHASNRHSIRYLQWCGFSFGTPFERNGELVMSFRWAADGEQKKAA